MKRLMLLGLAALSAGLLCAKDMYWIGGTSGTWSATTWADINGKTEDPTTGNYVCYVTNTTPVTITVRPCSSVTTASAFGRRSVRFSSSDCSRTRAVM